MCFGERKVLCFEIKEKQFLWKILPACSKILPTILQNKSSHRYLCNVISWKVYSLLPQSSFDSYCILFHLLSQFKPPTPTTPSMRTNSTLSIRAVLINNCWNTRIVGALLCQFLSLLRKCEICACNSSCGSHACCLESDFRTASLSVLKITE